MSELAIARKANMKKRRAARPLLEPARIYSVPEGAAAAGVAAITFWRAIANQYLKHYRVDRSVKVSGAQILAWLEAGGKTGHGRKEGGKAQ